MLREEDKLASLVKDAERLHGHLGPFLVVGVRMGIIARRSFDLTIEEHNKLEVTVKTPLLTPFSCVIDGIQAITSCTVGNQRLNLENSEGEITAHFHMRNSNKTLKITVNSKVVGELMNKISRGASNEELAWKIAYMPEGQLFKIKA